MVKPLKKGPWSARRGVTGAFAFCLFVFFLTGGEGNTLWGRGVVWFLFRCSNALFCSVCLFFLHFLDKKAGVGRCFPSASLGKVRFWCLWFLKSLQRLGLQTLFRGCKSCLGCWLAMP